MVVFFFKKRMAKIGLSVLYTKCGKAHLGRLFGEIRLQKVDRWIIDKFTVGLFPT